MTGLLHHRTYLTCYDTAAQALYDRTRSAFLIRAALLTELALGGHLADADGDAVVTAPGPTGDPVLDRTLDDVATHRRSWKAWVRHDRKETLEAVEDHLAMLGVLTVEEKASLGPGGKRRVTVTDPAAVTALQDRLSGVLHASGPVAQVDAADAALVVLAAAGSARSVVSRKDRRDHKDRIEALTARLGEAGPGLEKTVRTIRMTMIAAQGGMGGS
ncbi:GOLPH3/VPS74 family protein [Streptomyces chattanoogensis]|uniref:GPP34 family phosphoprotein n=1 Tax=Streptomyces chattanoogensis TaxID=66876 RepID=A0A0N0H1Q0_9ACTN|nr:GPP34 family phosphoprotein [Streptomyces chattanoogensis]KPC64701.1 hypothetical protein ADL29_11045 [Streptomyces chattanoogensis]